MNDTIMQSTLRELQLFLRSPRFWLTFSAVVAIFAISGPFGTLEAMGAGQRLIYWLCVHAAAWSIAITFAILADVVLRSLIGSMFWRMMAGSLVAAIPITFVLTLVDSLFGVAFSGWQNVPQRVALNMPLCAAFCVLTFMAMRQQINEVAAPQVENPLPSVLGRLKPQNRGELLRLSVQDHYTEVVTSRGRELLLLRFSDALNETGGVPGIQVHRSHWVSEANFAQFRRDNGRLFIQTTDDASIPVSRTHADAARRRFGT